MSEFELVSSPVGPWEQGIIVLLEAKKAIYQLRYVDPTEKPTWFLEVSPHGKMPVLRHRGQSLFESSAIAEYLEDVSDEKHHPADPMERALNRAWLEYLNVFQRATSALNNAKSKETLEAARADLIPVADRLEDVLSRSDRAGPYFNDASLSIVDARYAPFLQRVTWCAPHFGFDPLASHPQLSGWSATLMADRHVAASIREDFDAVYRTHLAKREAYLADLLPA